MSQIICRDLSIGYDGHTVSSNISFTVERGDYLCIVGKNGSGKTTLMRALLGLNTPVCGEIIFGDGLVRSDIGYLPQRTDAQNDFPASVEEVVLSGFAGKRGFHPFYGKWERRAALGNMSRFGIKELARHPYGELSGGQQQRVLLARALCATDKLLLLDEPVSGLDAHASAEMYSMIYHLNRDHGITVIMITHDLNASLEYSNKILQMGSTPRLFTDMDECKRSALFSGARGCENE